MMPRSETIGLNLGGAEREGYGLAIKNLDNSALVLGVVGGAVGLGILGDGLLRAAPWGLNLPLWTLALILTVGMLARWQKISLSGEGWWFILAAIFFAIAVAWRDSNVLMTLNILALMATLLLAARTTRGGRDRLTGLCAYAWAILLVALKTFFAPFILMSADINWGAITRTTRSRRALAVGRGLIIAIPLLLVFGGLFVAADAAFGHLVAHITDWSIQDLLGHLVPIGFLTWFISGYLHEALIEKYGGLPETARPAILSLGITEIGVVLGTLNLLFFAFVIIQFGYLFGGLGHLLATPALSYAEYARSGFFELVAVTALVLPVLLSAHWLLKKDNPAHERIFRILSLILIANLVVIMVSALKRMLLYQSEYGLTETRFYTTAFMGWLGVIFAWFIATVLRRKRERFAFGVLATGFLTIALLNVVNPDALIISVNASRANLRDGRTFDADYAASLSADGVEELLKALPKFGGSHPQATKYGVMSKYLDHAPQGWRRWNWSRSRARQAVLNRQQDLYTASSGQ